MSNGALTGMIKHNYKNKLLTIKSDWIEMFWAFFFKETVDSIEWNRSRSEFQALGPENEKARSPKIMRSLGRMYREVEADRRPVRVAWSATSCTVSLMKDGERPVWIRCIMKHNLYWILDAIGSQWSWRRPSEMLTRGCRFNTIHAAAFWTRWRVAIVDFGNPASMLLQ